MIGYVAGDGRQFRLTPRVLELGFSYLSALSVPEIVQPHLEALSREVDESVRITIGTRFPRTRRAWAACCWPVRRAPRDAELRLV